MYRFVLFAILSTVFLSACSGSASDNSNANAANQNVAYDASEFTDANAALTEGSRLLDVGDTDKAVIVLKRATDLNPDLADAYFKLGIAYALVETRDAAVVEEQVTPTPLPGEKKPKTVKTNSEKAFEKAVEAYKKQVEANPNDHAAFFNLGRAYNKLNEDEDAAKAYKQAVKLNAEDTEYQTDLGAILIKLAQYREAIGPLKKAIELDPDNSRAADLLEDAEAGRKRVDFSSPDSNSKGKSKTDSNSNTNSATSDTNTSTTNPPPANSKPPKPPETKPKTQPSPKNN